MNNKELIVRGFIDNQHYEMQPISVVKENKWYNRCVHIVLNGKYGSLKWCVGQNTSRN
jgi:hypothetical protein